jgi:hypothetical protein
LVIRDERVDHCAGAINRLASIRIEQHRAFFDSDFAHRLKRQIVPVDV